MLSWVKSAFTTAIGFVVPGAGAAFKFGPWILAGLLFAFIMYQRVELQRDAATISGDSTRCSNTQLSTDAKLNSTASVAISAQHAKLDTAEANLQPAATASQVQGATALAQVHQQATQPGYDGPIPPVLVNALAAMRSTP